MIPWFVKGIDRSILYWWSAGHDIAASITILGWRGYLRSLFR